MSQFIVVSNSTPLIALSKIGRLELLKEYFTEIMIPEAVYEEVVVSGGDLHGAKEVEEAAWIKMRKIQNDLALKTLETSIGRGEAESIVLAKEVTSDLLLIDDADGRRIAQGMGLKITGTVGILLMAAKQGRIDLRQALDRLLAAGFRLSEKEYLRILGLLKKPEV